MSHAIVKGGGGGGANRAQLYLDGVLKSLLQSRADKDLEKVSVAEVLLFCMKRNRTGIFMINGATDESFTTEQILKMSVRLARALIVKNMIGRTVMMIVKNTEHMAVIYYGALFAGTIPFMIDPNCTMYELNYFKKLICPCMVFCEQSRENDLTKTVNESNGDEPDIVVADSDHLQQFVDDFSDKIDDYRVPDVDCELPVMMLPTSGSTGLPKAAMLSHKALVAQLPTLWTYHHRFPRPTNMAMLVSTAQWVTHTLLMTTCPVYQITMLMSPTPTISCLLGMIRRYKPTWALLGPAFANSLTSNASTDDLASLQTVLTTGAQQGPDTIKALKAKLSQEAHLCNGYGMTEAHGFVTVPDRSSPIESVGKVVNILDYELLDESGKVVANGESGEMVLRSEFCILRGYYQNKKAYRECITEDRWWKTGDVFYENKDGDLFFVERKKFWFKYLNYHISPEELEAVIGDVSGVEECVVCETPNGAAAAVVRRPNHQITEEDINHVVNSTLSDYKHLRGGVVFATTLPHTHSGKLHRADCRKLVNKLLGYTE